MMAHTPMDELNEELETAIWYAQHGGGATQEQTGHAFTSALSGLGNKNMQTIVDRWREEGRFAGLLEGRQEGVQQGMQQGMQQGVQQVTMSLLHKKFGALNKKLEAQITALPVPQLTELSLALLDFQQPQDLTAWLKKQSPKPARKPRKKE